MIIPSDKPHPNTGFKDRIGERFERLVIIEFIGRSSHKGFAWRCLCDCGNTIDVQYEKLRAHRTKSCGCLMQENQRNFRGVGHPTHGCSETTTYASWIKIKERCFNPNHHKYPRYGGRGITVCDQWSNSFENFLADMGKRPEGTTIDRIDNDGDYCPENCRWGTGEQQANNKSTNVFLTFNGVTQTIAQWGRELNLCANTLYNRRKRGLDVDKILMPILR